MGRLCAVAIALVASSSATAAEITRVVSSFEEKDPFGLIIGVGYERLQRKAMLVREVYNGTDSVDAPELVYKLVDQRLNVDARIGIYEDVELNFRLPLVFAHDQTWSFASASSPETSSVTNNCYQADGQLLDPSCLTTGAGAQPLYNVPGASYRGGVGNVVFGLKWAIFNQRKDDSKPTWVVALDYEAPTASLWNPSTATGSTSRGGVGDKVHHYTFSTALSRRIGVADPYFRVFYTLPFRGPGWYSNCDNPSPTNMGAPENCGVNWSRSDTGIKIPHRGGFMFGTELVPFEKRDEHQLLEQKFAIDLRGLMNYVSEGRYMNPLADLAGKLQYSQDHLQLGGQAGIVAHASDYLQFNASANVIYNTAYTITQEPIGKDVNGNGQVDVDDNPEEINPSFDWRTDLTGRRFRAVDSWDFGLNVSLLLNF